MSSSLSSRASTISSTTTSFHSSSRQSGVSRFSSGGGTSRRAFVVSNAAQISFVRDSVETCVPDVKLTKSRDGTSGTAFFTFENPDVFEGAQGDITGMYMADEEGEMTTVRVVVFDRFRRISSRLIFGCPPHAWHITPHENSLSPNSILANQPSNRPASQASERASK